MIRFFVSSTFMDMQGERQLLHARVLPRIQAYAERLGEYIDFCDLRWGIDLEDADETSALQKVMDICLDAIDDCAGYMLCFLGDHYGTALDRPQAEVLRSEWVKRNRRELAGYGISLTQMELEYGVFQGDRDRCLCFCRSWEGEAPRTYTPSKAQQDLVSRLADDPDIRLLPYKAVWDRDRNQSVCLDALEEALYSELVRVVDETCRGRKDKSWQDLEFEEALAFAESMQLGFAGRTAALDALDCFLSEGAHTIGIYGRSGIGKSAFLAKWVFEQRKKKAGSFCYISCGRGDHSKTVMDVLVQLIYFVQRQLRAFLSAEDAARQEKDDAKKLAELFSEREAIAFLRGLLLTYDQALAEHDGSAYLVLDAVNQLASLDDSSSLRFLYDMRFARLTLLVSQVERPAGCERELELLALTEEDIREIFARGMVRMGRSAIRDILGPIRRKPDHLMPLYIRGVISILKMHLGEIGTGDNAAVFAHHRKVIESLPGETNALLWRMFEETAAYVSDRGAGRKDLSARSGSKGPGQTAEAALSRYLELLGISAFGIADAEAKAMLDTEDSGWDPALITYARLFLRSYFKCDMEGRWTFAHDRVTASVRSHTKERAGALRLCAYAGGVTGRWKAGPAGALPEISPAGQTVLFYDTIYAGLLLEQYPLLTDLAVLAERLEAKGHAESLLRGLFVRSLRTSIDRVGTGPCRAWILQYPAEAGEALTGGLMPVNNQVDPNRRIAAIPPANLYVSAIARRPEGAPDTLAFAWLLKQLIDIHDDISRQQDALMPMRLACDYVSRHGLAEGSAQDKDKLIRTAKLVFFCANKLIKKGFDQRAEEERRKAAGLPAPERSEDWLPEDDERTAIDISDRMLAWYDAWIRGNRDLLEDPRFKDQCASFTNNIGQRFNAVGEIDRCFPYRFLALGMKVPDVLRALRLEDQIGEFERLCQTGAGHPPYPHAALAEAHCRFWACLPRDSFDEETRKIVNARWQSVAITYRSLGSDYFYWPRLDPPGAGAYYRVGCAYLRLTIFLLSDFGFQTNDKELTVLRIRLVGMLENALSLYLKEGAPAREEDTREAARLVRELTEAADQAVDAYREHAVFDIKERENLQRSLASCRKAMERAGCWKEEAALLAEKEERLRR